MDSESRTLDTFATALGAAAGTWRESVAGRLASQSISTKRAKKTAAQTSAPRGGYTVGGCIGAGGMGKVYAVEQHSLERAVAMKTLPSTKSDDPWRRELFTQEARATGVLQHPNIVPIYEFGETKDGRLFYTMPQIVGQPWNEILPEQDLSTRLNILLAVADAVAYAHSCGIIHRDLKTDNVMLGDYGEVLLMDWGLAAGFSDDAPIPGLDPLTACAGTPSHMAPEMARGAYQDIGPLSDIYLLGAMLFVVRTGQAPHAGTTASSALLAAAENRLIDHDQSDPLLAIARKAMAYDPDDRHQSVQELQEDIRAWQEHRESLELSDQGLAAMRRGLKNGHDQQLRRALAAFEQALILWPENSRAEQGLESCRHSYAELAESRGDLELALQLAEDLGDDLHQKQLLRALRQRKKRQQRVARLRSTVICLTALLICAILIGAVTVSAFARQATDDALQLAASERDRAETRQQALDKESKRRETLEKRQQAWEHLRKGRDLAGRHGQHELALQAFDKAIAADPSWSDAWFERGHFRVRQGRNPEATEKDLSEANRLHKQQHGKELPHALRLLGDLYRDRRDAKHSSKRAIAFYRRAADIDPNDPHCEISACAALYLQDRHKEAHRRLAKATKRFPGYWEVHFLQAMFLAGINAKAQLSYHDGLPQALPAFDRAIRLEPKRANLYHNRAAVQALIFMKQQAPKNAWNKVYRDLDLSSHLNPHGDAPVQMGIQLATQNKHWDRALSYAQHWIEQDSTQAKRYITKARIAISAQQRDIAINALHKALKLQPQQKSWQQLLMKLKKGQ